MRPKRAATASAAPARRRASPRRRPRRPSGRASSPRSAARAVSRASSVPPRPSRAPSAAKVPATTRPRPPVAPVMRTTGSAGIMATGSGTAAAAASGRASDRAGRSRRVAQADAFRAELGDARDTEELHRPDGLLAEQLAGAVRPRARRRPSARTGRRDRRARPGRPWRPRRSTSAPLRIPPSTYTSARSPTAAAIAGSCSSGVGARSSWRPPWLEMTIASAPASTTARASSTVWMPLMTSGPVHASRSQPKSAMVIVGSKTRLIRSATVPPVSVNTANWSGSVVSLSNHQPGCRPMSTSVRSDSVGGIVKPLWTSRSRAPGDRRVDGQDERPEPGRLRAPDEVERRRRGRSTGRAGTSGPCRAPRAATSSGDVVPSVDSAYGMPSLPGDARDGRLALVVHQPREAGRREDQRQRRRPAEDRRRRVDRRHVPEDARARTRSARTPRASAAGSSRSRRRRRRSRRRRAGRAGGRPTGGPRWSPPTRAGARPARGGSGPVRRYGRSSDGAGRRRRVIGATLDPGPADAARRRTQLRGRCRADERAERLEVAVDQAVRPRLDQHVADRRRLDRTGDHRAPARVGGELAEQRVAGCRRRRGG